MAMPFDMNELFTAHFSISTDAAETARKLKRDLGFESNYEVARLENVRHTPCYTSFLQRIQAKAR